MVAKVSYPNFVSDPTPTHIYVVRNPLCWGGGESNVITFVITESKNISLILFKTN